MSDAKEQLEALKPILEEFRRDPKLREFHPVIEEMLEGIENPDYDNTAHLQAMVTQILMEKNCYNLAIGAHQNAAMHVPPKKWYEYDD